MYVLVRYNQETGKHVVKDTDIRRFRPIDIDDFDRKALYDVWWAGDEKTRGGYYPAHILHMTQTEAEMQEWNNNNRCLSRKQDDGEPGPRKKAKLDKQAKTAAKKAAEQELLRPEEEETNNEANVLSLKKKVTQLEGLVKRLKIENVDLKKLNKELQRALCAKIFETGQQNSAQEPVASEAFRMAGAGPSHMVASTSFSSPRDALCTASRQLPSVASPVASAEVRLAHQATMPQVDAAEKNTAAAIAAAPAGSLGTSGLEHPPQAPVEDGRLPVIGTDNRFLVQPSKALGKDAQKIDPTVGTMNEAGEVHLGHGNYMDRDTWQRLLALPTDSAFCKQLAVRLWGSEILCQRSLTGSLSNRAISKGVTRVFPALSPVKVASMSDSFFHFLQVKKCPPEDIQKRHKCLRQYLAQKCADLRR
ncbi:uncharacterized protein LOC142565764 [Dermacentor variabilis]|uniref:uncharacterized protein LOC142565764 n=1 Tax=Dermacentor variabilis TaxID=34621 RepID=UPI003F5B5FAB